MSTAHARPREPWTDRLARWIVRWRLLVVAGFLGLLVAGGAGAIGLPDSLSGGGWYAPGSQSSAVASATTQGFVGRSQTSALLVVTDSQSRNGEADFVARTDEVYRTVTGWPGLPVESGYGWSTLGDAARAPFLGADERTVTTRLGIDLDDGTARRELPGIQDQLTDHYAGTGLTVTLVGAAPLWGEINQASEQGLVRAEIMTLPVLALIMFLLYRGVTPALLSTAVAGSTVVLTYGVLSVVVRFVELSVFVQNAATMLGLGVAVDYSLFINSRFREERSRGVRPAAALAATMRTAGRTVVSSGATVTLAMATLFVVDLPVIRSLAIGAVTAVVVAVAVNILLLPALLMIVARRPSFSGSAASGRHGLPRSRARTVQRATDAVMQRPVVALLCGLGLLLALALPAHRLSTFTPDARVAPADTAVRVGYDQVRMQFGIGAASPVVVVVSSDIPLNDPALPAAGAAAIVDLPARLAALDNVTATNSPIALLAAADPSTPLNATESMRQGAAGPDAAQTVGHFLSADGKTMVVELIPTYDAASPATRTLVEQARVIASEVTGGGVRVDVGGETAEGMDGNSVIEDSIPLVLGMMLAAIFVLLLLTFRSIALPIKAILLNLASVAATYGVLVVVFQDGIGAGLLGFEATGQITNFVPIVLLTLLFSLSTDYEVFLLSRVHEETLSGFDNRTAVSRGMVATAPLISGAAFLMVAVFIAFTFTGVLPVQQLGLGMAVAVALDATVVRLVLVPASMRLMGRYNWWLPSFTLLRGHSRASVRKIAPKDDPKDVSTVSRHSSTDTTTEGDHEGRDRGRSWTAETVSKHR